MVNYVVSTCYKDQLYVHRPRKEAAKRDERESGRGQKEAQSAMDVPIVGCEQQNINPITCAKIEIIANTIVLTRKIKKYSLGCMRYSF